MITSQAKKQEKVKWQKQKLDKMEHWEKKINMKKIKEQQWNVGNFQVD